MPDTHSTIYAKTPGEDAWQFNLYSTVFVDCFFSQIFVLRPPRETFEDMLGNELRRI
jgi:hypothetical protein